MTGAGAGLRGGGRDGHRRPISCFCRSSVSDAGRADCVQPGLASTFFLFFSGTRIPPLILMTQMYGGID